MGAKNTILAHITFLVQKSCSISDDTPSEITTDMLKSHYTRFGALGHSVTIWHKIGHIDTSGISIWHLRYDPKRVPPLPLCQDTRQQYLRKYQDMDLTGYPSNYLRRRKSSPFRVSPHASVNLLPDFSSERFETELESISAKLQSPKHLSVSKVSSSKSVRVIHVPSSEPVQSVERLVSQTSTNTRASEVSITTETTVVCDGVAASNVSLRVDVSYTSVVTADPWYTPWAEVGVVEFPSTIYPIAPDGEFVGLLCTASFRY